MKFGNLLISEGQQCAGTVNRSAVIQQEPVQARQVAQVRATLEEELVNVAQSARALKRMKSLLQKGICGSTGFGNCPNQLSTGKGQDEIWPNVSCCWPWVEIKSSINGTWLSDLSTDKLEEFVISSPDSGTILQVLIQPGELITSGTGTFGGGTVLMTLADLNSHGCQCEGQ